MRRELRNQKLRANNNGCSKLSIHNIGVFMFDIKDIKKVSYDYEVGVTTLEGFNAWNRIKKFLAESYQLQTTGDKNEPFGKFYRSKKLREFYSKAKLFDKEDFI